jgi:hypothetical protein
MNDPKLMTFNDIKNTALKISEPSFFTEGSRPFQNLSMLRKNYELIIHNFEENFDNYLKGENLDSIGNLFSKIIKDESSFKKNNELDYPFSAIEFWMGDISRLVSMNFYLDNQKLDYSVVSQYIKEDSEMNKKIMVKFEINMDRLYEVKQNQDNLSKKLKP